VARRLILDTGVLIRVERGNLDLHQLVGDDDPAIASVTATEMLVGVENSVPGKKKDLRALHTEALLSVLPVESYNLAVARMHAILLTQTQRAGQTRSSFDLIVAATAGATGRTLITTDKAAEFDALPGVNAEIITLN
jgi:tRNA(fMet)-specific endonuclease VapC